jgi:fumarate hydratase, class II
MSDYRTESDSLGLVEVPAGKLWGAQSIGRDLMPREMITAYATLKKAAAANQTGKRLDDQRYRLIVQASNCYCYYCCSC